MNNVEIKGRLISDPQRRGTNGPVTFTVSVVRYRVDRSAPVETDLFNMVAWQDVADHCLNSIKKGDVVFARAAFRIGKEWKDKDDKVRPGSPEFVIRDIYVPVGAAASDETEEVASAL